MTTNLQVGDRFPDFELPNQDHEVTQFQFTQPSLMDTKLGFLDGYPLILVFYRGFFCPRDLVSTVAARAVSKRTSG